MTSLEAKIVTTRTADAILALLPSILNYSEFDVSSPLGLCGHGLPQLGEANKNTTKNRTIQNAVRYFTQNFATTSPCRARRSISVSRRYHLFIGCTSVGWMG